MQDLVTIVTLILPFVFVIAIVWITTNEKQKRRQLQAELYLKALEKGQPMPTDLFMEDKKKPLKDGIILIAVSIAITVFLWLLFDSLAQKNPEEALLFYSLKLVGFIPFMAGVAQLITYFIGKKKDTN